MAAPRFEVFTGAKRQLGPTRHLVGLTLDGAVGLQAVLAALGEGVIQAAAAALYREAEAIMTASKEIVPVDLGILHGTGHVELPETHAGVVEVTLGYGGPAAPYAIVVHEDLTARHKPGQQAKYLEQPALEASQGMEGRLADALRSGMERRT